MGHEAYAASVYVVATPATTVEQSAPSEAQRPSNSKERGRAGRPEGRPVNGSGFSRSKDSGLRVHILPRHGVAWLT